MAEFTVIPDANLEPDKPARSIDALALRDNPIAIAEGAEGAPRIEDAALDTTVTTAGTDWVLARNAGAATGVVGAYMAGWNSTTADVARGGTLAGSSIRVMDGALGMSALDFMSRDDGGTAFPTTNTTTLSGTWRAMAYCQGRFLADVNLYHWFPTLWLRIS